MRPSSSKLCLVLALGGALAGCEDPTYTLSGTVTGLAGTGLALAHDGAILPIEANGDFSLPGRVASGADYSVTVSAQPSAPEQVCTVTGGSGVARANVIDIVVTCTTTPNTIVASTPAGGSTTAATDVVPTLTFDFPLDTATVAGHVTLSRGSQLLSATAAATTDSIVTVTPTAPLALLTRYTLTADVGLLGTYGETTAPNTSVSFTTRDGTWHAPVTVELDTPNAQEPSVAILSDGSAIAVWYEYDGPVANIWANRYTDANGWGTAALLETNDTGDAFSPRIVADAQGHAFVAWSQSNGTRSDIWGTRYTVGTGWSVPGQVSDASSGTANYAPSVGVTPSGDAVVAWSATSAGDDSIWSRSFPATGSPGLPTRIETLTGNAGYAKLVIDATGDVTLVFANYDMTNSTYDLWVNRRTSGTWGTPVSLETSATSVSEYAIGLDGAGHVFVAWTQAIDGSSMGVYARRLDVASGWSATATLDTTTNATAYTPEVAADAVGNALVLWGKYVGSTFQASSSYFTVAGGFGSAVPMPQATTARVAFDASGNALAIWYAEVGSTSRVVRASRYTVSGGWGTPMLLTPGPMAYGQYPSLAIDALGGAIAVWVDYDVANNRLSVAGARFDDRP